MIDLGRTKELDIVFTGGKQKTCFQNWFCILCVIEYWSPQCTNAYIQAGVPNSLNAHYKYYCVV